MSIPEVPDEVREESKAPEVIAAIPTYNSPEMAMAIGRSLLEHGVEHAYILDDASNEEEADKLHDLDHVDEMTVEFGKKNIGPGRNRNRILKFLHGAFRKSLVLFIDADMELVHQGNVAEVVQESFLDEGAGAVGYRILNRDGSVFKSNFGPLMNPGRIGWNAAFRLLLEEGAIQKETVIEYAPQLALTEGFIVPGEQIRTGGVAEGCFAVRSEIFRQIKGFDSRMRYHEAHDLHARIHQLTYKTMFNPTHMVRHLEFASRPERRLEDDRHGLFLYFEKHWGLTPQQVLEIINPQALH